MRLRSLSTGLPLLIALAAIGYSLVVVPPNLIAAYGALADRHPTAARIYLVVVGVGTVCLALATIGTLGMLVSRSRRKRIRKEARRKNPSQLTADQQRGELERNLDAVACLRNGAACSDDLRRELDELRTRIDAKRESSRLEIVAFGSISGGKSSLLNLLAGRDAFGTDARGGTTVARAEIPWPGNDRVSLVDTPGLGEIDGAEHVRVSTESAKDADIVLVVVDGPLRDFEFDLLSRLGAMEKRVLLCLNKADWYDAAQRERLRAQLAEQIRAVIDPADILFVMAEPVRRRRIRVGADGAERDEEVAVPPDIGELADRLLAVVTRDGRDLLLANLLLQSRGLVEEARDRVQASLDRRAWELIDWHMWAAGGAAAVSPLPVVDLAAGGAVTVKLVLALARVYRREIDVDAATRLLAQLGKNLVGILGVGLATPAIAAAVGSLLKTVPGAGTLAGGFVQGVTQAILTRWIGGVFLEYFKRESLGDERALTDLARDEWERVTSVPELRKVVETARRRLAQRPVGDAARTSGRAPDRSDFPAVPATPIADRADDSNSQTTPRPGRT
ncbi:MAG: DUF697 domain-containing protein [Planctomycetes bacterium]|nr:DUF697 domain-containing protein [Planctomycetota bacterium]